MKRSISALTFGMTCALAASFCPTTAAEIETPTSFVLPAEESFVPPSFPWTGRVVGIRGPEPSEKKVAPGLATFTRSIVARGRNYRYTMVGSDPYAARPTRVVVPLEIVPIRLELADGVALDPTEPGPGCAEAGTPLENALESPVFTDVDYGDGNRQYVEETRRVEFWALVASKPTYSVRVAPVVLPTITLTYTGSSIAAPCGRAAVVPLASLNHLIQASLIPQIKRLGVSPKTFPLFLFSNVFFRLSEGGVAAGYHSAMNLGGVQTYGVAEYDTTHFDPTFSDVTVLSHEIAEWYDDPFVNNATPAWGHTGQVEGCQGNLEVGDPLTGSFFDVPMPNGLTYHPQELAFFSWFFNQAPSLGFHRLYSWGGTLTAPASLCQ